MPDFWTVIRAQLSELTSAASATDVIRILGHDRNPYRPSSPMSSTPGFFAGSGGDGTVSDALETAGWAHLGGSALHYAMRAPDGSVITYCEGDVSIGDTRA